MMVYSLSAMGFVSCMTVCHFILVQVGKAVSTRPPEWVRQGKEISSHTLHLQSAVLAQ